MKKSGFRSFLSMLLSAVMLISVLSIAPISVGAADEEREVFTVGDYQYSLLDDGSAEIVKYTGTEENVTVPTDLDGKKVSRIGNYSFENNTTIKSLTIPAGIEIGDGAFRYSKIETLDLKNGVETIGSGAFSFCESLKTLTLPDSVTTIDTFAFQSCKSLTSVKLSNRLETISDFAFTSCESLTSIDFPSSIKEIGQNAFAHCYGLTSVVIPGNVKIINTAAFSYCRNLSSVTLNEGIETISAYAFSSCLKLAEVTVPDSVTEVIHMAFGYWWDEVTWNYLLVDGFVLKGYRGSAADSYAQEYGVTFVSIGDSILTPPTTAGPTEPTEPPVPGTVTTVYFKNNNFNTPYAYYWPKGGQGPVSWPGVAMTKVTDDIYKVDVPVENNMILFSDKGNNKTPLDLDIPGNNYIYDGSEWSVYTDAPTEAPTQEPTEVTTTVPVTDAPTTAPVTEAPTNEPTEAPTTAPVTEAPTQAPTDEPTEAPTTVPVTEVTEAPTQAPTTTEPDETVAPTQAPTEAPTLPAEGTFHVVAGDAGLCNGVNWDPTSAFNLMTLGEDGVYSIVYENVPAGQYNFKVTTNGAWDIADFNLTGDAKFGGPNAVIDVTEDGSWVTITFKESDMHANAYINDVLVDVGATEPATKPETEPATTEPATEATTQAPTVCNHSATKITTTAATYFAKGKTVVTCADCGKVIKTTSIAKKVLKTPTVTVKAAKKSIKVTYKKKIKNATGFVIRYQIKGKKKVYTKTYKSNKKVTKVIRKLKSDKKYTVKVRAYVKSGNKIAYSKWTKAKTVKVK